MKQSGYQIICKEGELAGSVIVMQDKDAVLVGRDPKEVNLVFRDMTISRKHCLIETDKEQGYFVTDYSECGITLEDGMQLSSHYRTPLGKGSVLLIGKAGTKIELG